MTLWLRWPSLRIVAKTDSHSSVFIWTDVPPAIQTCIHYSAYVRGHASNLAADK